MIGIISLFAIFTIVEGSTILYLGVFGLYQFWIGNKLFAVLSDADNIDFTWTWGVHVGQKGNMQWVIYHRITADDQKAIYRILDM